MHRVAVAPLDNLHEGRVVRLPVGKFVSLFVGLNRLWLPHASLDPLTSQVMDLSLPKLVVGLDPRLHFTFLVSVLLLFLFRLLGPQGLPSVPLACCS